MAASLALHDGSVHTIFGCMVAEPRSSVRAVALVTLIALGAACGGKRAAIGFDGSAGAGGLGDGVAGQSGVGDAGAAASDGGDDRPQDAVGADAVGGDLRNDAPSADVPDNDDASGTFDAGPPRLAANGVPIPALTVDPCPLLDLQSAACGVNGGCAPLSCDCGGKPIVIEGCTGLIDECVTRLSCAAACAMGANAQANVLDCLHGDFLTGTPACKSEADCRQSYECIVPANATSGQCVSGQPGSPCLADTDCQEQPLGGFPVPHEYPACVVWAQGLGRCGKWGLQGEDCNTDAQCSMGVCLIAPGAFEGSCNSPGEDSPCYTQHDCQAQPTLTCVVLTPGGQVCSSRGPGAPCASAADCTSGPPFCVDSLCSQGVTGDPCRVDADCQHFCGANGSCSDGTEGNPCRPDNSGCYAGLKCSSGLCQANGACRVDADCPAGNFCVDTACSDGATGSRCKSKSQCQSQSESCSSLSICSLGLVGDPCGVDADCQGFCGAQGTCSDGTSGTGCRPNHTGCAAGLSCATDPALGLTCVRS